MESRWLSLTIVVVLLGGCASDSVPPSPVNSPPAVKKPSQTAAERPAAQPARWPGEKPANPPKVDAFGLPLVIVVEMPEVPKEIRGPSPPIHDEPRNAGQR